MLATTGALAAMLLLEKVVELAVPETPHSKEDDKTAVPPVFGTSSVLSKKLRVVVPLIELQEILVIV